MEADREQKSMIMPPWLLELIRCPITLEPLEVAPDVTLDRMRGRFDAGLLVNRIGVTVTDAFQSGLVNASGTWFYPVVEEIPVLVPDEAIPCE